MMNYDTLIQDRRSWFITCIIKKTYGLGSWHPCHHFKLNPVAIPPAYRYNLSYLISLYVPLVTRGMASILSEVMMYVSIIGLQLWLVIEMIYCYRKIAAAGEEALRESAWVTLKTQTHTHTHSQPLSTASSNIWRSRRAVQMSWFPTNCFHSLLQSTLIKTTNIFLFQSKL